MSTNRVSATLSTTDKEAVMAAIGVIREKLPFLIDLTTAERVALPKLGDKTQPFVHLLTLLPGHLRLPQKPKSVSDVPGILCNLCARKHIIEENLCELPRGAIKFSLGVPSGCHYLLSPRPL